MRRRGFSTCAGAGGATSLLGVAGAIRADGSLRKIGAKVWEKLASGRFFLYELVRSLTPCIRLHDPRHWPRVTPFASAVGRYFVRMTHGPNW